MNEMIEIFDEENNPKGIVKERNSVHSDGDFHRASHVCILSKDKLICHRRSKNKRIFPRKIDIIVGGHLKPRESYEDAAIREVKEELGLDFKKEDLKFLFNCKVRYADKINRVSNNEFVRLFYLKSNSDISGNVKPQKSEIDKVLFLSSEEIISRLSSNAEEFLPFKYYFRRIIKKIREVKNETTY